MLAKARDSEKGLLYRTPCRRKAKLNSSTELAEVLGPTGPSGTISRRAITIELALIGSPTRIGGPHFSRKGSDSPSVAKVNLV